MSTWSEIHVTTITLQLYDDVVIADDNKNNKI